METEEKRLERITDIKYILPLLDDGNVNGETMFFLQDLIGCDEKFDGREAFLKMQDYWAQWHIVFKWIRDAETLREAKTIFT